MKLQGFKESKGGKEWTSHSRTRRKEREWHRVVLRNDYCVFLFSVWKTVGAPERGALLELGLRGDLRKWDPKHQEREQFLPTGDINLLEGEMG